MSLDYEGIVREYLNELDNYIRAARNTAQTTPELSYRPALDRFLRAVSRLYSSSVDVIFEPKLQGHSGRPDWRIYDTENLGLYGFVEAKALELDRSINVTPHMEQITRYLGTGQPVILTDGLEFIFFNPGNTITHYRVSLIDKSLRSPSLCDSKIDFLMDGQLGKFFQTTKSRQCTEEQIVNEMAIRAARLSECVFVLTQAPSDSGVSEEENETILMLHNLQSTLRLHHDPALASPKVFADFVAQVLFFGLLYAHRIIASQYSLPRDRYAAIQQFWADAMYASYAERLIPFKVLIAMLESELSPAHTSESPLRCWYDDARRLLAHVQLRSSQIGNPDYHTLYEQFLTKFDPRSRFDFGSFYTPPELACFTVGAAEAIIKSRFDGRHLFENGNKIIDPCCGTGTFIEQLVCHSANQPAVHLVGFEILPAPYALAHYRMGMLNFPNAPEHVINIFLTNTLIDDLIEWENNDSTNTLRDEFHKARGCSQPPIVLVIGNPPSSDSFASNSTGDNFLTIDRLLIDFRPPATERHLRQNSQKQIGNDFMKFLRWSSEKVLSSDMGVLALILPSTFAAHPTYHHAREWLIRNFSEFWVLDIDRDLRTGAHSSSLFDVQQGRMLLIATHAGSVPSSRAGRLHYATITDKTRKQKKDFLRESRMPSDYLREFTQCNINSDSGALRPVENAYNRALYARFWAIHPSTPQGPSPGERCIFIRHCSGIKLAPTSLFVHSRQPILQRRSSEIGNASKTYDELKAQWFSGQRKPPASNKLTPAVRNRFRIAAGVNTSYRSYAFRPFVCMQILFDNTLFNLMGSLGGGGTRIRPEVVSAFTDPDTVGIAIAPSPIDIGADLHRFATFCWDLPDNDLCSRGNSHIFCNKFPEYKPPRGLQWDSANQDNIADAMLNAAKGLLPNITLKEIVFYTYAMLCSSVLLDTFAPAYFTASATHNIPRIPLVNDATAMRCLVNKGRELAELENPHLEHELHPSMAGLESIFQHSFNLQSFELDEELGEIRLFANSPQPQVRLSGIPIGLFRMTISGYDVIACWLKWHSFTYTRTEFRMQDHREFVALLSKLIKQVTIIEDIDSIMNMIIAGEIDLL